jgi:hypothetical protein
MIPVGADAKNQCTIFAVESLGAIFESTLNAPTNYQQETDQNTSFWHGLQWAICDSQ